MPRKNKIGSDEFFSNDKAGKKQDAALHEEILRNSYNRSAVIEIGKAQARKAGLSEEEIALLYAEKNPEDGSRQ